MTKQVSGKQAISYRNYRRARDRALVRLAHLYPDTYKQLLVIERSFDEQEGKKWIGIDGFSNLTVGTHTRASGVNSHVTLTADTQAKQSYNEGEA
jgi:hypothetical protein